MIPGQNYLGFPDDIEVFDIELECNVRYRRSDTRHRGGTGKDPDEVPACGHGPTVRVGITVLVTVFSSRTGSDSEWRARCAPGPRLRVRVGATRNLNIQVPKDRLEPCRPSISKFGPSISLYYDIASGTSISKVGQRPSISRYAITTRYRMFGIRYRMIKI